MQRGETWLCMGGRFNGSYYALLKKLNQSLCRLSSKRCNSGAMVGGSRQSPWGSSASVHAKVRGKRGAPAGNCAWECQFCFLMAKESKCEKPAGREARDTDKEVGIYSKNQIY